ncbi:MAG TPA: 5'-nucleotidase C-terminal domain-containing protein [Pyrinomonadaceae bacterium]
MKYFKSACGAIALLIFLIVPGAAQQGGAATAVPTPTPQASGPPATPSATPTPLNMRVRASERAIDDSIPNDPAVDAMLQPYSAKVRALGEPIGKLVGELKKGGMGAGSLGNFVADAIRDRAQAKLGKPVLLAITNSGGLRKNQIAEGNLTANDIYELLPFENALISLDLTGEQLKRFLNIVVSHRDAQSGARITYRTNDKKENEVVAVKLGDKAGEMDINPSATYTIVTIDYLVKRGGDYALLQEAKNVQPLNMTIRDAVLDYVRAETAAGRPIKAMLDGRFRFDKPGATKSEEEPQ